MINRPTRITKTSETAVDHILTNTILEFEVRSAIIKNETVTILVFLRVKDRFRKKED